MAAGDIHRKTELGLAEIKHRKLKLHPRVRTMLILVDGVQPEFLLKEEGAKVGAPTDFLEQLLQLGLVEKAARGAAPVAPAAATAVASATVSPSPSPSPSPGAGDEFSRFRAAKDFMNVTVVDALGIKSFFFTLKLERAGNLADLRELVSPYRDALAKGLDDAQAEVLATRLRDMLR